jgi:hypothetical protein
MTQVCNIYILFTWELPPGVGVDLARSFRPNSAPSIRRPLWSLYSFIFRLSPLSRAERSAATHFLCNTTSYTNPNLRFTSLLRQRNRTTSLRHHNPSYPLLTPPTPRSSNPRHHFRPLDLGNLNPILIRTQRPGSHIVVSYCSRSPRFAYHSSSLPAHVISASVIFSMRCTSLSGWSASQCPMKWK